MLVFVSHFRGPAAYSREQEWWKRRWYAAGCIIVTLELFCLCPSVRNIFSWVTVHSHYNFMIKQPEYIRYAWYFLFYLVLYFIETKIIIVTDMIWNSVCNTLWNRNKVPDFGPERLIFCLVSIIITETLNYKLS